MMIKRMLSFGSGREPEPVKPHHDNPSRDDAPLSGRGLPTNQDTAHPDWPTDREAEPDPISPSLEGTDRWSPIIIDDPIFDFEPRPPDNRSWRLGPDFQLFRADTVFDGWSTDDFTLRLASVRGYSHRYNGLPRQDDAEVAFHQDSGTVLFAVADGVSSASLAHVGATTACSVAIDVMRWQLDSDRHEIDLPYVVKVTSGQLAARASAYLRQESPAPTEIEKLLATTLVTGYVRQTHDGTVGSIVQIGDSGGWILRNGRYFPVVPPKNDPEADVITSAVSPLPRVPADLIPADFLLPHDAVLLIGTDGFGDPLGDGDGKVGQLFAEHLWAPPPPRALAHLLDFSRDTFDDDRTLLALWPRPQEAGRTS
jgi:hypothetical protein